MIVKQGDIRANIKKYFDIAHDGEPIIVPRRLDKNVVIISEDTYNRFMQRNRIESYTRLLRPDFGNGSNDSQAIGDVYQYNMDKLKVIKNLSENWNGNGAHAFKPDLIKRIKSILDKLTIQPEIFPTALNTIQFEYDNSRRDHMEIEIGDTDTSEVFTVYFDGTETFDTIYTDAKNIDERVRQFYG